MLGSSVSQHLIKFMNEMDVIMLCTNRRVEKMCGSDIGWMFFWMDESLRTGWCACACAWCGISHIVVFNSWTLRWHNSSLNQITEASHIRVNILRINDAFFIIESDIAALAFIIFAFLHFNIIRNAEHGYAPIVSCIIFSQILQIQK